MFTVVIPTMQKSDRLRPLVEMYCEHRLVDEVLIINNVTTQLSFDSSKVRVLNQGGNIYVNPAWNLGANEAKSGFLIISNDDISFDPTVIDQAAGRLRQGRVGMIGIHPDCFARESSGRAKFKPIYERYFSYGTLMFMERSNYARIPDDLLIWCGDDYLFANQTKRNLVLDGVRIESAMSVTSALPQFSKIKTSDLDTWSAKYKSSSVYVRSFSLEAAAYMLARRLYRVLRPVR